MPITTSYRHLATYLLYGSRYHRRIPIGPYPQRRHYRFLIEDLNDAADYLPWTGTERDVDKAVAYGLIARIGLFGGSFNVNNKGSEYFRTAADAAEK